MLIESRRRIAVFMVIELCLSNADLRQAEMSRCLGIDIDKYQTWDTHSMGINWERSNRGQALPKEREPGWFRQRFHERGFIFNRIVVDAVAPSVYTTPTQTIGETGSVCRVNSETALIWIRLPFWREICIVRFKMVNLALSAALAYTITTLIFWRKRFRVNTFKRYRFWRGFERM